MNPKLKKVLAYVGLALDAAITVTLFVISIILLVKLQTVKDGYNPQSFSGWFIAQPTRILLVCVVPLFVLLVVNIVVFYLYFKSTGKKKVKLSDLSEEDKEALRKKIAEELKNEQK